MGTEGNDLPFMFFVKQACHILNCSFMELWEHPQRLELISIAITLDIGEKQGDYLLKINPEYKKQVKDASKKMEIK